MEGRRKSSNSKSEQRPATQTFFLLQDELHHPIASDSSDTSIDANFLVLAAGTSPGAIWNSGEESQRSAITRLEEIMFPNVPKF